MKEDIKGFLKFILGFTAILAMFGTMGKLQCNAITFGQALIQAGAIGAGLVIGIAVTAIKQWKEER